MKIFLMLALMPALTHAGTSLTAHLTSPAMKNIKADVEISSVPQGVKFITTVTGLKPGSVHGFHVHENGKCDGPDFKSAGGHFNPFEEKHGSPSSSNKHIGDLGNLVANDKGIATKEVVIQSEDKKALEKYMGRSVIIHAKPDDLTTQPAGDSGDRMACGIIQKTAEKKTN